MLTGSRRGERWRCPSAVVLIDVLLLLLMLGAAIHTQTSGHLRVVIPVMRDQVAFWRQRAADLCTDPGPLPALPPAEATDPSRQLALLSQLPSFSSTVWRTYVGCQEPRTVVIDEELLHFKVDSYDSFETDPEPGYEKIRGYVDLHVRARNRVYVIGHCDDTYTDEYNYLLSYRRALQVAGVIRAHLLAEGRRPGSDFVLLPIGMGKSQLLERRPGEALEAWRTRCRRVEISFRTGRTARQPGQS